MALFCFCKHLTRLSGTPNSRYFIIRTFTHFSKKGLYIKTLNGKSSASLQLLMCQPLYSSRPDFKQLSSHVEHNNKSQSKYTELYLFQKIRFLRLLGRLSKYSFLSFVFSTPICVISSYSNLMSLETCQQVIGVLAFYSLIFTGHSFIFTSRILAKMMISADESTIKLSHLSLFGDRRDLFLKPSDFIPFTDVTTQVSSNKMVIVKLKNSKKFLFFPDMGSKDTNYEMLELILSGGLNEESDEVKQ